MVPPGNVSGVERRLAAAAALLLSPLLAGCGSDGSDTATTAAESSTSGAASTSPDPDHTPLTEQTLPRAVVGAVLEAETGRLTMEVMGVTVDVAMRLADGGEVALAGTTTGHMAGEVVVIDGAAYVREEGDRKWFRLPDELVDAVLSQVADLTPARMAQTMREGLESLEYLGTEEAEGTTLHGYQASLDKAFLQERVEQGAGALGLDGNPMIDTEDLPETAFELWLDADDLVRRLEVEVAGLTFTAHFSDWGEPVEIEAPPASQVTRKPLRLAG